MSRAFPTFLPPILFLLFLSRRDAGISRGTARAKRKAREETFRPSTRFRSPFRSFVRSFVRSNRGPITRSEPDSRSRFLDFVARNTIHRSTFPRSLSPSVLESTLPLGSTPRFTVARRDTRSSGIQRWTKTTESRSKEVKKRARMDNGLARSVTRKSR